MILRYIECGSHGRETNPHFFFKIKQTPHLILPFVITWENGRCLAVEVDTLENSSSPVLTKILFVGTDSVTDQLMPLFS